MKLNIALAGISHETNTFSPLTIEYNDLLLQRRADFITKGEMYDFFVNEDVTLHKVLMAWSPVGGKLKKDAYLKVKHEIIDGLRALEKIDGVCLVLHGALVVEEIGDGESDLIKAVRECVGDEVLISASLDLHGNIGADTVRHCDILRAYRTAPHRDVSETRIEAARLLIDSIRRGIKPVSAFLQIPVLLPGEKAVTDDEPAKSLYAMLEEIDATPGIVTSTLMTGFGWADIRDAGMSAIVIAESDEELAMVQAQKIAQACWERRADFKIGVEAYAAKEAVQKAKASSVQCFMSDSGDNPTAGGACHSTVLLRELIEQGVQSAVFGALHSEAMHKVCQEAGVGGSISYLCNEKHNPDSEGLLIEGAVTFCDADVATVDVHGCAVIVSRERIALKSPEDILKCGVDIKDKDLVVVKLGYLYPDLVDVAPRVIMALTPGVTSVDIENLEFKEVRRPVYPLDKEMTWSAKL